MMKSKANYKVITGIVLTLTLILILTAAGAIWMTHSKRQLLKGNPGGARKVANDKVANNNVFADNYSLSLHFQKGIQCAQCHNHYEGNFKDFSRAVSDRTCGGCHIEEYTQLNESRHFKMSTGSVSVTELAESVHTERPYVFEKKYFIKDRLCVACHLNQHTFKLSSVRAENFCSYCHQNKKDHYVGVGAPSENRCIMCHVLTGETSKGQKTNTHRFTVVR